MRGALARPISTPDLAQLCGVPERTLHRHFVAFIGAAPLEHFRRMRLAAAREALLAPCEGAVTVTEVAMRFGFLHLGRFAVEYRERFGETPSATLARGRATIAEDGTGGADGPLAHGRLPYPSRRRDAAAIAVVQFRPDPDNAGLLGLRRIAGGAARDRTRQNPFLQGPPCAP